MHFHGFTGKAQPIARSGHRAVANDDFMWVLGGYNPNNSGSDINQAFSLFKYVSVICN